MNTVIDYLQEVKKRDTDIGCELLPQAIKRPSPVITEKWLQAKAEALWEAAQGKWFIGGRYPKVVPEPHRKELNGLEILLMPKNEQLQRVEQEIISLTNRIQAIENQKRMDISYTLASEDAKRILNLLVKKVTINIDEVAGNINESDVINVVCDLCKARLANLKGKKLIVTSLGLKVAKKLHTLND